MKTKRTVKKAMALLLAFIMVFGAAPAASLSQLFDFLDGFAISAQAASVSDLTFKLINGGTEYEVDDCLTSASGSLTIPSTYNGKPVTSIGLWAFSECTSLSSITIGNNVTSIGSWAFSECTSLSSITVGSANANYASQDGVLFSKDKTSLIQYPRGNTRTSYSIPDSVTSISDEAFYYCTGLKNITVNSANANYSSQDGVLFNKDKTHLIQYPIGNTRISYSISDSVTSIGDDAFSGCTGLSSVTIGNSVTSIGDYAFRGCTSLSSITIPDSVTSIGSLAFFNTAWYNNQPNGLVYSGKVAYEYKGTMSDGTAIEIKDGTKGIADYAFYGCTSLSSVLIPDSVTSIGTWAFCACYGLSSVTIGNSVTIIGDDAFLHCTSLSSITIPDSVTSIGSRAFRYCAGLSTVTIGNSVTSIGEYAFFNCTSLSSVTIGNSVASIGDFAFRDCTSLSFITIPNSVTSIGDFAFYSCDGLERVQINGPSSIDSHAFADCTKLTTVVFQSSEDHYIEKSSFEECPDLTIYSAHNDYIESYASVNRIPHIDLSDLNSYDILFDANGGTGAPMNQTKPENIDLTLSSHKPTKKYSLTYSVNYDGIPEKSTTIDYNFVSWNTEQDGSGTCYESGGNYAENAEVTLWAQWTDPTVENMTAPTREYYDFDGWYTSAQGGTKVTAFSGDQTVYAHWKAKEYTISFNSNGGNGAPENQTMTYGSSITLSDTVPTKICTVTYDTNCDIEQESKTINCSFMGWNTAQDGSGTTYEPGDSYAENAAATLWAQWEALAVGDMPTLTREYYAFDGWYTDKNSGTMVTNETPVSSNITVYAHWTVVPVIRLRSEPVPGATPQVIYYNKTEPMKNYGGLPVYTVYPVELDNKSVTYSSSDDSVITIYMENDEPKYLLINASPSANSEINDETAGYIEYKVTITIALTGYSDEVKHPDATRRIPILVRYPKETVVHGNGLRFSDTGTARLNAKDTITRTPVFEAIIIDGKSYEPTNKELKYVSSNEKVAHVDSSSGKVTALRRGTAVITATSVENSTASASYTVEVSYTPVQWIIMILFFGWLWYLR